MKNTAKPGVKNQGKAVIQFGPTAAYSADGGDFYVMTPDGQVQVATGGTEALKLVRQWAKKHMDATKINALTVEWRVSAE